MHLRKPGPYFCSVCEGTDHNAREKKLQRDTVSAVSSRECPLRVIRIEGEPGSAVFGSDLGTR
jgi:hypothetical protein